MKSVFRKTMARLLAPALALLVLGGLAAQKLSYASREDAGPYHQRVREAIDRIPQRIGDWSGTDVAVPSGATKLLRPNVICSRRYQIRQTGQAVSLLVVHCRDARDMGSHYPPVCYRANGWELRKARPVRWEVDPQTRVPAVEYEFSMRRGLHLRTIWVVNVLLLPNGTMSGDISSVGDAAADYRTHFFGAGQVQLIFGEDIRPPDRQGIFKTFMNAIQPVIEAIGSGVER